LQEFDSAIILPPQGDGCAGSGLSYLQRGKYPIDNTASLVKLYSETFYYDTGKGVFMRAKDRHIYSEINNKMDMEKVLLAIRDVVDQAKSRAALTELYKRAGYLITLTHSPS